MVFLVVGRAELFTENDFDPAAKASDESDTWLLGPLFRVWIVTLVVNLIGYAGQDPFLVYGTVAEKLSYGAFEATDEEIREAAVAATADRSVRTSRTATTRRSAPAGKPSAGLLQRVSIARALLRDP